MSRIKLFRRVQILAFLFVLLLSLLPNSNISAQESDNTWLEGPTAKPVPCKIAAPWAAYNSAGAQAFHNAVDFCGGIEGSPIYAVDDCTVVYVGWWPVGSEPYGHGNIVACWHPDNRVYTYDSHLKETSVIVGQEVKKGDILGLEGQTGKAAGPHDHFVVAIRDPLSAVTSRLCPTVRCWPNPMDFLGKDVVAQDLGLITYGPNGEIYLPSSNAPRYTGGLEYDPSNPIFSLEDKTPGFTGTTVLATTIFSEDPYNDSYELIFEEEEIVPTETAPVVEEITITTDKDTFVTPTIATVAHPPLAKWERPLKWALAGLVTFFCLACVFSPKFRKGAVPVVMITVLAILVGLLILSFLP